MSVMGSLVKTGRTEVTEKLRREVERVVKGYVEQGVAEVVPGVVFIDEVGFKPLNIASGANGNSGSYARYRVLHISQCSFGISNGANSRICNESWQRASSRYDRRDFTTWDSCRLIRQVIHFLLEES